MTYWVLFLMMNGGPTKQDVDLFLTKEACVAHEKRVERWQNQTYEYVCRPVAIFGE